MKMKKLLVVLILIPVFCFAAEDEENYESIVSRLSAKTELKTESPGYSMDNTMFHMGVGFGHSAFSLASDQINTSIDQNGFSLMLGMDLMSPQWNAEIGYTNYYRAKHANFSTEIQEFDLRVLYKGSFSQLIGFRIGTGLAARYLHLEKRGGYSDNFTTPASVIFGGLEAKIAPRLSLIAEVGAKNSIVSDSPENRAIDFLLRIDGHL